MVKKGLMVKMASHYTRPGVPIETAASKMLPVSMKAPGKGS